MDDLGLPGIWGLSPLAGMIGMVVIVYWMLLTGRLITRSSHEREIGIYKEQILVKDKTIEKQTNQITSLLSVGQTMQAVLRSAGPVVDENTEQPGGS